MILGCFAEVGLGADKLLLISVSLFLAVAMLLALRMFRLSTKSKVALIYTHLIFLFFPIMILTTHVTCGVACLSCANNLATLVTLALPSTLIVSTGAAFFVIPAFYMLFNRKGIVENAHIMEFVKKNARRMKIKMPRVYITDNPNPVAYSFRSFRSAIFMSAGLMDILNKKEIEAVLLHELAHIKRKASILTTSLSFLKFFSPLAIIARFHHDSDEEEREADRFAIRAQGTDTHVRSARQKMEEYEKKKVEEA